jgi:hypothetical protein
MSQTRPEIPQFSDISDEEAFYDTKITSISGPAEFTRSSKFLNPLLTLIIFPDLSVKANNVRQNKICE